MLPKSWAQLVTYPSPFEMGWTQLRSVSNCCNKTHPIPKVHPILLIRHHIIPQELLDHQVHLLGLSIGLGAERSTHLEFRPHTLPQGSPKLACELWVPIRNYVLWKAMVLKDMCEE